jgi:hypothetical protein
MNKTNTVTLTEEETILTRDALIDMKHKEFRGSPEQFHGDTYEPKKIRNPNPILAALGFLVRPRGQHEASLSEKDPSISDNVEAKQ